MGAGSSSKAKATDGSSRKRQHYAHYKAEAGAAGAGGYTTSAKPPAAAAPTHRSPPSSSTALDASSSFSVQTPVPGTSFPAPSSSPPPHRRERPSSPLSPLSRADRATWEARAKKVVREITGGAAAPAVGGERYIDISRFKHADEVFVLHPSVKSPIDGVRLYYCNLFNQGKCPHGLNEAAPPALRFILGACGRVHSKFTESQFRHAQRWHNKLSPWTVSTCIKAQVGTGGGTGVRGE